jgi:MFS family permease
MVMVIVLILVNAPGGASAGAIQEIIPNRLRGRVTALYYALQSLVGISAGPLVVGLLNDYLFRDPDSVGKSIALIAVTLLPPAAILLVIAGRRRQALDWVA